MQVRRMASVAAMAMTAMAPQMASAQQLSDQWQFRATIYGWFPDIEGKTTFPAVTGSSINVDSSQIIDSLKFVFMGTLEAQKGRWGAFTDVIYVDIGGSNSQGRDLTIGGVTLPSGSSSWRRIRHASACRQLMLGIGGSAEGHDQSQDR